MGVGAVLGGLPLKTWLGILPTRTNKQANMGGPVPTCIMSLGGFSLALAVLLLWYRVFGCYDAVVVNGINCTLQEAKAAMSQMHAAAAPWVPGGLMPLLPGLQAAGPPEPRNTEYLSLQPLVAPELPAGPHTTQELMNVAFRDLVHEKHATVEASKSKPGTRGQLQWGRLFGSDAEVAAWERSTTRYGRPRHPVHSNVKVNHAITNQGMWKPATPEEYTRRPVAR